MKADVVEGGVEVAVDGAWGEAGEEGNLSSGEAEGVAEGDEAFGVGV